jgi:hypothetical protein
MEPLTGNRFQNPKDAVLVSMTNVVPAQSCNSREIEVPTSCMNLGLDDEDWLDGVYCHQELYRDTHIIEKL